jgi:NarL family two-component system response regulator LiaR
MLTPHERVPQQSEQSPWRCRTDATAIRVLVVGQDALFRLGLTSILERPGQVCVVGQTADMAMVSAQARHLRADEVLLDFSMAQPERTRVLRHLLAQPATVPLCALIDDVCTTELLLLAQAGVRGILTKAVELDALVRALATVAHGRGVIDPYVATTLLYAYRRLSPGPTDRPDPVACLSVRECQVLRLLAEGATNQEIADELRITENTVKVHLRHITEKLRVRNRHQAAALAVQLGVAGNVRTPIKATEVPRVATIAYAS